MRAESGSSAGNGKQRLRSERRDGCGHRSTPHYTRAHHAKCGRALELGHVVRVDRAVAVAVEERQEASRVLLLLVVPRSREASRSSTPPLSSASPENRKKAVGAPTPPAAPLSAASIARPLLST